MIWNAFSKAAIAQTVLFIPVLVASLYLYFYRHQRGRSRLGVGFAYLSLSW